MTNIQITGLIFSFVLFCWSIKTNRNNSTISSAVSLLLTSFTLFLISIYPDIIKIPTDLFSLNEIQGGRLIMLSMIFICIHTFLIFRLRITFDKKTQLINKFIIDLANSSFKKNYKKNTKNSVWVIIPAFDEEKNIAHVIKKIPKKINNMNIVTLVVDDGSSDTTSVIAKNSGAKVVRLIDNIGGGMAIKSGIDIALDNYASFIVTIDGDGQHNPNDIPKLLGPLIKENKDIVIGSRIKGSHFKSSWVRTVGIYFFNYLINIIIGKKISDCSSGFRAMKAMALIKIKLKQDQYHTAELIIKAAKNNLIIDEVPIHIGNRISGVSKKGPNIIYGLMFLRTIIKSIYEK